MTGKAFEFTGDFDMDFLGHNEAVRRNPERGTVEIVGDAGQVFAEFRVGDVIKREPGGIAVFRRVEGSGGTR